MTAAWERPIRLVVREDDLRRSRLTVLLRPLLVLPHVAWLVLWGVAAAVSAVVLWLAVLVRGRAPVGLHELVARYLRYATHVAAYLGLAANPYPGFRGVPGYPVDLEVDPPTVQSRLSALVRLGLALPALALASALGGGLTIASATAPGAADHEAARAAVVVGGVAAVATLLAWFAILARGEAPRGLRDLVAYAVGYGAQAVGYLALLTDRYPSADPALAEPYAELPEHPVCVVVADDLRRPRLLVLFRLALALPHLVWLALWALAALVLWLPAWGIALVTGRVPSPLRRFFAAFVRYDVHVNAFLYLVGRRFPGFTGTPGSYEIDVEVEVAEGLGRWRTLGRLPLALPAFLLALALNGALLVAGVLGWWYALVTGRMPEGLRNLGAACVRYWAQTNSFFLLLTERYPYAAPVLDARARDGSANAGDPS